ncbi:MAG: 2-oxoacid:acceptor oxidoreductase subunit alpha [Patescibacteria group bacterium]|jgi:2-oxoglutarate ferredoxin oxidoreductase subunit alpha
MITNKLQWKIGGEAGFGIMTTGVIFSKICTRGGLRTFAYPEYPSLIRGGHNTYQVTIDAQQATSQIHNVHLLVALNKASVTAHAYELMNGAAVIYDPADFAEEAPNLVGKEIVWVPVAMNDILKAKGAERIARNTIAIGASFGLLNYPFEYIEQVLKDWFGVKKPKLVEDNLVLAKAGYDATYQKYANYQFQLEPIKENARHMVLSGNRAIALGALQAGMKFYAAYPMTPSSDILGYMAKVERDMNIVVKHTEDEIAAMNMIIGAGMAGVRAMTGTSGGGFALMTEALGMAGMAEVPIVTVMGQRPGPSTGMPTWTAQGDLRMTLHASQGEYPMIVLAPGDIEECFYYTYKAFNLAEQYQLPVIILVDKYVQESWQSVVPFDTSKLKINRGKVVAQAELDKILANKEKFLRYKLEPDGISARSLPGMAGGRYIATSYEHDEYSTTTELEHEVTAQYDKRFKKLDTFLRNDSEAPKLYGEPNAAVTIVGWGSTKLTVLETLRLAKEQNISVNYLHFVQIQPLPVQAVQQAFANAKKTICIEGNKTGQLEGWLKQQADVKCTKSLHKYGGRPFYPEEILEQVKKLL